MKKRLTCILLALVMAMSFLTILPAAGAESAEELPNYEIDVFSQNANFTGLQSGWFGRLVKDKFNMGLNITATNLGAAPPSSRR